jgi:4-hydroxy-tetrahydrodipicolinate synthase
MTTLAQLADERITETGILTGGIFPACITTFAADESLDTGALRAVLEYQLAAGVDGIVVAGTTGEAHSLSFEERRELFRTAIKIAGGRVPVVGGAGATTSREALRLIHLAAECGCSAAMVLTPWFEHPTPDALLRYFEELVRSATLPILLYNNPSRTGLDWPPAAIARMARELGGGVIGIKDSANNLERVRALRSAAPENFRIYSGGPHQRAAFEAAGADGCIDGPANLLATEGVAAMRGDARAAEAFAAGYTIYDSSRNFIALLKASMELAGLPAGKPRRPNDVADAKEVEALAAALKRYGRLAAVRTSPVAAAYSTNVVALGDFQIQTAPIQSQTNVLYSPGTADYRYSHHACLAQHEGAYFAAWSSGIVQEDSPGQTIRFSIGDERGEWTAPRLALDIQDDPDGRWTAGGLCTIDRQLWLMATRYTRARYVDGARTPDVCWEDLATFGFVWDGARFQPRGRVIDDFYSNEAPRLAGERWIWPGVNARHDAIVAISADGAPGTWQKIVLFKRNETVKLTEPSWFVTIDGRIRMLFRDDGGSRRIWICESRDGIAWSAPAPSDMPDAQSKFFAFELCDGRRAIIGNATASDLRRRVLTLSISADGERFERCIELRREPDTKPKFPGMHKAPGFQYPNALAIPGGVLAIYSINKEDIAVQRITGI